MKKSMHGTLAMIPLLFLAHGASASSVSCPSFEPQIHGAATYDIEFKALMTGDAPSAILTIHTGEGTVSSSSMELPAVLLEIDAFAFQNNEYKVYSSNAKVYLEDLKSGKSIECKPTESK